ncbi:MAG TPA: dockerin type I domain-containing protein [Thermoguttaceae bacterium]|nr:dockerin type I domain-containing protein [Thermoguttaceae bacterium]
MVLAFNGTHFLGDVIGPEWAGADLRADMTFSYFTPGNPQALTGTISLADGALAPDKVALLPGYGVATSENYTNYSRGINALAIDVQDLADPDGLDAASVGQYLAFRVGNDAEPGNWTAAPAIAEAAVWPGRGVAGSDRVLIAWEDNAVENQWLEVTVQANARTGLSEPCVFYFGNAVAETGNSPSDARVTAADLLLARNNLRGVLNPAGIDDPYDFNRDGRVNATDVLLARNNQSNFSSALKLIDLSGAQAPQPALSPELAWLAEYGQGEDHGQTSEKSDTLTTAADALLAVYFG